MNSILYNSSSRNAADLHEYKLANKSLTCFHIRTDQSAPEQRHQKSYIDIRSLVLIGESQHFYYSSAFRKIIRVLQLLHLKLETFC